MMGFAMLFVASAALATIARALVTADQPPGQLPTRTLAINVAGAAVLGLLIGAGWNNELLATVAVLGSVTTFSSVAAEAADLVNDGKSRTALAYVGLTIAAAVAAAWISILAGEAL